MTTPQFAFTPENLLKAQQLIRKYPEGRQRSAVVPVLDLAQRQNGGWVSPAVMETVAELLKMPLAQVREVVSFYTMLYDRPMGRHVIQVCTTTPCCLVGSDQVLSACCKTLGTSLGTPTPDGFATVLEVECLGACVDGPIVQINDTYYEQVDADQMIHILGKLREAEAAC